MLDAISPAKAAQTHDIGMPARVIPEEAQETREGEPNGDEDPVGQLAPVDPLNHVELFLCVFR
jgi:hypothetical protein